MALFQNGTELDKPLGSEIQMETLPELSPPRHDVDLDGNIVREDDAAWVIRQAIWATRTRTITLVIDDGSLLGLKYKTSALSFNATPAAIEAAILAVASTPLVAGDIKVTGSGRKFFYEFSGAFANKAMKRMYSGFGFINQVLKETMTATGGTRTLTFDGQTTAALAFNASAATVQTAVQGLSTVGAGNILVTAGGAGELIFTYAAALSGAQSAITVDPALLTGGTSVIAVTLSGGGSDGTKIYFETIVQGASENLQRAIKEDATRRALGGVSAPAGSGRKKPADIGDPARYNADGSPNQR